MSPQQLTPQIALDSFEHSLRVSASVAFDARCASLLEAPMDSFVLATEGAVVDAAGVLGREWRPETRKRTARTVHAVERF